MKVPLHATSGSLRRINAQGPIIDGEAEVIARRIGVKSDAEKAAAAPPVHASVDPDAALPEIRIFSRRADRPCRTREQSAPDLMFQAQSLARFARPPQGSGHCLSGWRAAVPQSRRMIALGVLVLATMGSAALLLAPGPESAARVTGVATGFVLTDIETGISARGTGAVLSVAGLIRNVSDAGAPIPSLRMALADEAGTMQTRPIATGARSLAAGGALRFHSTVAVPAGTRGDILVDFVSDDPGVGGLRKIPAE